MTKHNKTKADITIATIILFSFFAFFGFFIIFFKSEGALGDGLIVNFIADYILYLFPFVLLYEHFQIFSFNIFLFAAGLNILFYSFLMTKLFSYKLMDLKSYKPFKLTITIINVILSVILVFIIFLIATS